MRKRMTAIALTLTMALVAMPVAGQEGTPPQMPGQEQGQAPDGMPGQAPDGMGPGQQMMQGTLGVIVDIGEGEVTIALGSLAGPGESDQESGLLLTGEEKTYALTGETSYRRSGSFGGGMPQGGPGEAMQMPEGQMPEGEAPQAPEGGMPQMPEGGQGEEISLSDLSVGRAVSIEEDEEGNALVVTLMEGGMMGMPQDMGGMGGPGGGMPGASGVDSYEAVMTYTADETIADQDIVSNLADENAVLVQEGAEVTLSNVNLVRESADSTGGDTSSFYGVGAAALVTDGTLKISGGRIDTDSKGGAGVFAYGDGVAYVEDTRISTLESTSGGIHVAGGGQLYATNVTAETNGGSSAAIRSDRGGGTMLVEGGSFISNGVGSPAVYCTADITVSNADLAATGSEAVCIEGLNTLRLDNCNLSGNMPDDEQNDCTWTVIVYQSMSGDSEVGNGTFEMTGGTLTSGNGGLFYTTNTECTLKLDHVAILPSETNAFFLRCTGNANARGWGMSGANGSQCTFTAIDQEMPGDVIWDSISTLDMTLKGSSTLTGAILQDESYAGEGGEGSCSLTLEEGSTWVVTADSTLTSLTSAGSIVDSEGNQVSIVGSDGTVYVQGSAGMTIMVDSFTEG